MGSADTAATRLPGSPPGTPAQTRVIDAALRLFAERGIAGTSLQMIADSIGVTKAAVYHQYRTKEEIVLAVAEVVLGRLDAVVTVAEAEPSRARAREVLVAGMVGLAVEQRRWAGILQRDPIMLLCQQEYEPFRRVMERLNRILMGASNDPQARVRAAAIASTIAGAVIHPLALDLGDDELRAFLLKEARRLLPRRG